MKIAPIVRALRAQHALSFKIIHTGQHYDHDMNDIFFEELGIPQPDWCLAGGGGGHAQQTQLWDGKAAERIVAILARELA